MPDIATKSQAAKAILLKLTQTGRTLISPSREPGSDTTPLPQRGAEFFSARHSAKQRLLSASSAAAGSDRHPYPYRDPNASLTSDVLLSSCTLFKYPRMP